MSRSSDPENPFLDRTLFPNVRFTPDPSNPDDFHRELQAIDLHLWATTASLPGIKEKAKYILNGTVPQSEKSPALRHLSGLVSANAVENNRERRPALDRKRARFSLKPNVSQPDISLGVKFDSKKYKDPEEYFTFYERNENAKKEVENQMGGAILDGDKQNPSPIARARRPGIPRRSVKYKHRISALENEIISTQDTCETSILSPPNHSSQTESEEKIELDEMDLTGSKDKERNNDILAGLLSQPTEELEGDGALRLVKESLHIKNIELEDICLQEVPDIQLLSLKSSRRALPNPRPVKPKQRAEGSIHLASPTPPKSPLASLSLMSKRSSLSIPSNDPFSADDIDRFPVTNPSSVENRNKQTNLIDIAEQKIISGELKSPLLQQNDNIESSKTGSCKVAIKAFTNASKRSKRDSLSKRSVAYDVDMEEEIGGSKVTSETFTMPEDDTDTRANGFDNGNRVEEEEASPEVNAEDSSLEKFNSVQSRVIDDVIDSNKIREEDMVQEAMPEHNVVDSTLENLNRVQSRVSDKEINHDGVQEQDKLQDPVACAEHGFDVAGSIAENLNASSKLDQLQTAPVEEHPSDSFSRNPEVGLDKQNEIRQDHSKVSLKKPTEANSRSRIKQKKKEVSKRQSLAGHGTSWNSGVRRSTRIRTRPLEFWKGERLLIGRIHNSLPTVIGMKYASPGKGEGNGSLKVKSFVSDEHKMLVDLVSFH